MHSPISLDGRKLGFLSPVKDSPGQVALVRQLSAHMFQIPVEELDAATRRNPDVALARQSAMYVCHVMLRLSFSEIGQHFGRDRTTVAHACKVVEDHRDDQVFDELVGRIETAVAAMGLRRSSGYFGRDGRVRFPC